MFAAAWVTVFIQFSAIKPGQGMRILGEVCRHPVKQDTDIVLVAIVNEKAEIIRLTETAGRRKVACRLVAPGSVQRMLGNRQ